MRCFRLKCRWHLSHLCGLLRCAVVLASLDLFRYGEFTLACDALCDGCSGSGNTACSSCASSKLSVESTSLTCVNDCIDAGSNYFLDGGVCKECDAVCATCGGSNPYDCLTCAAGKLEIIDSPSKNPKHCTDSCGAGTFAQSTYCRSECRFT